MGKYSMKKMILASAAAMLVASPAFAANSATDDFQINAQIPETCTMQNVNDVNLGALNISTTAGNGALLLSSDATQNTNQFWVSCNKQNQMTLSGPTTLQGSRAFQAGVDDAGFTDKLNYRVEALNYLTSGAQPSFSSVNGAQNQTSRGPVHRQVRLAAKVLSSENTLRPLAGNYTGTVTVTVQTAL